MRKHRKLDGSTGKITVVPFTKEEEAAANKIDIQIAENNLDDRRIKKVFTTSDEDVVLINALFEIVNRLNALEAKGSISRSDLTEWLIDKLPGKSI